MKKISQAEKVLNYLEIEGSITPLDAVREFGIMCLAERIRDLRKLNVQIKTVPEVSLNRFGEIVRYSRYFLEGRV